MKIIIRSLFVIVIIFLYVSCGIDTYIYMEPVADETVDWDDLNNRITFYLPTGQIEDYFNEYIIYYHLYHSTVTRDQLTISEGDFSSINTQLYSDYSRIKPYTVTNTDSAPLLLQSLFETTLNYAQLTYAETVSITSQLSTITSIINPLDNPNEKNPIVIDFNLRASSLIHPILSIGNTSYRMLRNEVSGLVPSREFLNSNSIAGVDVSGTSSSYTYASFYIVAKGTDDSGSLILSNATFLGVLQLPE